jgi:hypothetical protein
VLRGAAAVLTLTAAPLVRLAALTPAAAVLMPAVRVAAVGIPAALMIVA